MEPVIFDVVGGLCTLSFRPEVSTGRDKNTNPGIGFDLRSAHPAFGSPERGYHHGCGVIARSDVKKLVEMMSAFLVEHPAEEAEPLAEGASAKE